MSEYRKTPQITYTVIIPHHNCPHLLERLLNSIPQREDIQIIVVDDASDDDKVPSIVRDDVELCLISRNETKGAGHARNIGMQKAKGIWLLFADSDDYYSEGFINTLDKYKDSNNDMVFFRSFFRKEGDETEINHNCWEETAYSFFFKSKMSLKETKWLGLSMPCPWNKMFRRSYINSIDCKFEEIPMCNDMWFVTYATANVSRAAVIDERLYNYIQYSSGITKSKRPLEHHVQVIKSDKRINRIKMKNGVIDLILLPGFNKDVVIRDFGKATYFKLLFKRILTEVFFDLAIIRKILVKLHIVNRYSIRLCQK